MGRYSGVATKEFLVSQDEYLLQLSCGGYRKPIETTIAMLKRLEDYPWPSYPAFVGLRKSEDWLDLEPSAQLLKHPVPFEDSRH
jgi:hypothetical protein